MEVTIAWFRAVKRVIINLSTLLVYLIIVILMVTGWVINLAVLLNTEPFILPAKTIIAMVGVFVFPVGSIMGWFVW
jgi:hypothetical protein